MCVCALHSHDWLQHVSTQYILHHTHTLSMCVYVLPHTNVPCVCVCVCERERESVCVCECVCVVFARLAATHINTIHIPLHAHTLRACVCYTTHRCTMCVCARACVCESVCVGVSACVCVCAHHIRTTVCNTFQNNATHLFAKHCNTLQHTATHLS